MQWLAFILILPYFFLLLWVFRNLLKIKSFNVSSYPETSVSVIVACHNEKQNIQSLLKSISLQDYPAEMVEIIIIDDNSNDKTFESAASYVSNQKKIILHNTGKGKKQAIRTGIDASSGNLIITTDADCRMGEKWIRTIAAYYEEHKPDMIICPVWLEPVPGFFGKFQELEFLSLQGVTAGTSLAGDATMCNGANLSFTREAYLDNSGNLHDEINSGDDIFLLHALKKKKGSEVLWLESADAMVSAGSSTSLRSFLIQRKRWLSKGKAYTDWYTILLGIATFVTILTQVSVLVAGFFFPKFLWVFLAVFVFKSVPDFLILLNTTKRYGKRNLLSWFILSQVVYPFYVLIVFAYSVISSGRERY